MELGYYAVPRDASLEAMADQLGYAASTASNHLRKAEAHVLGRLVRRTAPSVDPATSEGGPRRESS